MLLPPIRCHANAAPPPQLVPLQRFKSHQNTSKNFIGASFACNDAIITGGSEDGQLYVWDVQSGRVLERLRGHAGMVYNGVWNRRRSLALSCSNDGLAKTWHFAAPR